MKPGDIVYQRGDGDKHMARDPHLVASVGGEKIKAHKMLHSTREQITLRITAPKLQIHEEFLHAGLPRKQGQD